MKYEQGTGCWQGPNRSTTVSGWGTGQEAGWGTHTWPSPPEHPPACPPTHPPQVRLLCGKETVVTSTTEPSRCEYLMELMTPAACPEPPPEPPADSEHDEL